MRRDLSMVRRLEKIEKEIGYCEIKLEKEQRLLTQLHFLRMHYKALQESKNVYRELTGDAGEGNRLGGLSLRRVYDQVTVDPKATKAKNLREQFRCLGILPFVEEELKFIAQEFEDLENRLRTFESFRIKKQGLVDERERALTTFDCRGYEPILEISAEFERTEQSWNTLTEDLMNADEAIFFVTRAVEYVTSARDFLLSARSQFQIDSWIQTGYLIDLFKHSSIGRAKEMVEGADRNLKRALMELLCLEDVVIRPDDFEQLLLPFLDAVFDDLFTKNKLVDSMGMLEERCEMLIVLKTELETKREGILSCQTEQEENRVRLFNKMGDERKKLTLQS